MKRLEQYITKGGKPLRMGYTTGSCSAAAARAAAALLLTGTAPDSVRIETPAGIAVEIEVEESLLTSDSARCTVRKDAGDDPDVTDGALIGCTVSAIPGGFRVEGGDGVGRVTKAGLACAVGESAINPVPRRMIAEQLAQAARLADYQGGLLAVVDVPEGEALALRTFNPRLGIVGGISILGTTGIVEPMSESALVATIRAELDTLAAAGGSTVLLVPGNYGEEFARERWSLSLERGVKCSNYIGEALDYAVAEGFRRILLLGHGGKLVKLAAGIMNTHSRIADGRMEILTAHAALAGVAGDRPRQLMDCTTVDAADDFLTSWGAADQVWAGVSERVGFHLSQRVGNGTEIAFAAFLRRGIVMRGGEVEKMADILKGEVNA